MLGAQSISMEGLPILLMTALLLYVGNRTQGVHRQRHTKTGLKPERDTGSIILKPGTAKNKLFPGYGTNFRYIGEVKNGLDRVTLVTSIPIPKYSDIEKRQIIFNNCTKDLWRQGARTKGQPQYETYTKCNRVLAQAKFYQNQQEELQLIFRQLLTHDLYSVLPELNQTPSMYSHLVIKQDHLTCQTLMRQNLLQRLFDTMMYLSNVREEHAVTYREAVKAARDFLDGIAIVTQGRLPRALISDNQLREIFGKVDAMVKRNYPDYVLATKHISYYRDMKMVTFAVDQQTHSLIVTFPAFIKNYKQPPLSLYEVETIPVPILDKNTKADSYSQVRIEKSYIAAGTDYYIQLRISELLMCKNNTHIYYCEELFVIKHKSRHSCVSAIFYNLGPTTITQNCKFDYYYSTTVPPVILDGERDILLANFHGPISLKCSSVNGGLAKPAPENTCAVVNREFLCDCQLDLEHASILRQLSSCSKNKSTNMQ